MMPHGTPANSCSAFWHKSALATGSSVDAGHRFEQRGGGDFERRAAGEPAAERHVGADHRPKAARPHAARQTAGDHAGHVVRPMAALRVPLRRGERDRRFVRPRRSLANVACSPAAGRLPAAITV